MQLPTTTDRVPEQTAEDVNARIEQDTRTRLTYYAQHPHGIDQRLEELDAEWDIERSLEANAATVMLIGVGLGAAVSRKFYILPAVVGGFLLQHALQGWCPPMPILRRLGFRTEREIQTEREALKILRGDYDEVSSPASATDVHRVFDTARQ